MAENTKASFQKRQNQFENQNLVQTWKQEQELLRSRLILDDTEPWQLNRRVYVRSESNEPESSGNKELRYVAGVDISFSDDGRGLSGLFVFDISDNMKLVYEDMDKDLIELNQPYIPGFLAYREVPPLLEKLERMRRTRPDLYPQLLLVDGNGLLHTKKCGLACHLGLLADTPSIGVSKKLFQVFGLEKNQKHKDKINSLLKSRGDYFELYASETHDEDEQKGELLGFCYRSTSRASNPIYVSIGHKIGWQTCLWVVGLCITEYRVPEPIRYADLTTRRQIRELTQSTQIEAIQSQN